MEFEFLKHGVNVYYFNKNGTKIDRVAAINQEMLDRLMAYEMLECVQKKIILECSTLGDIRFSAFGAKIKIFGIEEVLEFVYQLSKGFNGKDRPPYKEPWHIKMDYTKSIKGLAPDFMIIHDREYDVKLLSQWYHLLWIRYLDAHPELVEYLKLFDDYNDNFKGKSVNCQADSIRKYIKNGRASLLEECDELNSTFKTKIR